MRTYHEIAKEVCTIQAELSENLNPRPQTEKERIAQLYGICIRLSLLIEDLARNLEKGIIAFHHKP